MLNPAIPFVGPVCLTKDECGEEVDNDDAAGFSMFCDRMVQFFAVGCCASIGVVAGDLCGWRTHTFLVACSGKHIFIVVPFLGRGGNCGWLGMVPVLTALKASVAWLSDGCSVC